MEPASGHSKPTWMFSWVTAPGYLDRCWLDDLQRSLLTSAILFFCVSVFCDSTGGWCRGRGLWMALRCPQLWPLPLWSSPSGLRSSPNTGRDGPGGCWHRSSCEQPAVLSRNSSPAAFPYPLLAEGYCCNLCQLQGCGIVPSYVTELQAWKGTLKVTESNILAMSMNIFH